MTARGPKDDEERFKRCKPLVLRTAGGEFEFPGVDAILAGQVAPAASLAPAPKILWRRRSGSALRPRGRATAGCAW